MARKSKAGREEMAIPGELCAHCGQWFTDHYWVANGEGKLLHMGCFDPYRNGRKKQREAAAEFMEGLEDDA